jgi:predicted nucleic acid-binding protein
VTGYCCDTDVLSARITPAAPLHLIRRLAIVPSKEQLTTSITVGELIYGVRRVGREDLPGAVPWMNHRFRPRGS